MSTAALRLVLDTHVWLELLHFGDPRSAAVAAALRTGHAVAVSDDACREEWRRVLHYPALRLDDTARLRLNAAHDAAVVAIDLPRSARPPLPRCADPDDQKFIELAVVAGARALLTRDAALLALATRLRREYGLQVVPPEHFAAADAPSAC